MSEPILMLATSVEISSTLGSAKTITAISKASEAVITATHDFSIGDIVLIDAVVGMTEINKIPVRVKSVSTTVSFVAEGLDSTAFTTYVSGGTATKITAFLSFDTLTTFSFPEPQPNKLATTTIHGTTATEVFGLDSPVTLTMDCHSQPLDTTIARVRTVSKAKTAAVLRATMQNGNVLLLNAYWAGGRGFDGSAGEVAKSQISLTALKDEQWFVS